jgi:transcriptional regulator with XRE-family HTH domain
MLMLVGMKKCDLAVLSHQEDVGRRLKDTIAALGLSAAEAARQMGVSPQRLNGWLSGSHPVSVYHLALFCRHQPVSTDWLLLGDARGLPYATAASLGLVSAAN